MNVLACAAMCPVVLCCCSSLCAPCRRRAGPVRTHLQVIKNIERGEQKIQRQQAIMNNIAAKLEKYKNPWQELKVRPMHACMHHICAHAGALHALHLRPPAACMHAPPCKGLHLRARAHAVAAKAL